MHTLTRTRTFQGGYTSIIRMFRVYAPFSSPLIRDASTDDSAHPTTTDLLALHGDYVVPTAELLEVCVCVRMCVRASMCVCVCVCVCVLSLIHI